MKYAVLFDLDGTLLDTLDDLADGVNYALKQFGYPLRTREEVRSFVGNGVGKLIARAVPEGAEAQPVLAVFREYYGAHCRVKTRPYDGIPEVLEAIREKYPVAIVSNKPDPAAKALCAFYFPGIYTLGETVDCPRKPAPDMVHKAMRELKVDACVYIGDSDVDVLTAKNAGAACISVLWGFQDEAQIAAAGGTRFCREPAALLEKIEELIHGQ